MTQADALAALHDGTAHMALLRDAAATDDWHAIPLYREAAVLVAPKESLVADLAAPTPEDLADETVLPVDLLDGRGEDAVALVAANVGVAVMPQSVARAQSRKDVLARLLAGAPDMGISLVWPIDDPHPLVGEFILCLGRCAPRQQHRAMPKGPLCRASNSLEARSQLKFPLQPSALTVHRRARFTKLIRSPGLQARSNWSGAGPLP